MTLEVTIPDRFALGAFDALSANVAILNGQGDIIGVNRAWQTFSEENGVAQAANYLNVCEATLGAERGDALAVAKGIRDVLNGLEDAYSLEYPCHSPTEQRYFEVRVTRFAQDGQTYVVVVHLNITRRKLAELQVQELNVTLERRVKERTAELERRNTDLSQFAYVASHDLQEPLRLLGAYTDVFRHRYQGRLDDRADTYIQHIVEQAARARQLVRDILTLSSVADDPPRRPHDLNTLLAEVETATPCPDDCTVTREPVPIVSVNAPQIRQLLTNLLSNSLKFRSETPVHVEFRGWEEGDDVHFTFRDNGIGIRPEHAQKVFTMFKRLHNRRAVAGNGIGLAVCQRVIHQHGGRIWVEAHPPGTPGVTVHFTLPRHH